MTKCEKEAPLLLESIKIENGKIFNLSYHQARCDKSRKYLFGSSDKLELSKIIDPPQTGLYRCRILYGHSVQSIEYIPYAAKIITTLKVVPSAIDYGLKYADRNALDTLLKAHPKADDVLIEKDGYLSDTTIANIAFYDGLRWFTPEKPLLEGTMRAKLIDEGWLQVKQIRKEELHTYSQVALMNAMIGFSILNHLNIDYK